MVFHTRVNVVSGNLFLSVLQFHEHKTTHWRYPLYYISLSLGLFFNIFLNFSWCRCVNVLLTNPIWVIVTRMQVKFHIKKCIYLWDPGICQPKLKYNFCFYDCPINLVVFRKKKKKEGMFHGFRIHHLNSANLVPSFTCVHILQTHTKASKNAPSRSLSTTPDESIQIAAIEPPPYGTSHVVCT